MTQQQQKHQHQHQRQQQLIITIPKRDFGILGERAIVHVNKQRHCLGPDGTYKVIENVLGGLRSLPRNKKSRKRSRKGGKSHD